MAKIVFESEKELEDYICEQLDNGYNPITNEWAGWYGRQVDIGTYGIIDILIVDKSDDGQIYATVIELKKDLVTAKSLAQVSRYMTGLSRYFKEMFADNYGGLRGIVSAPNVETNDDTPYLINIVKQTGVFVYTIDFDLDSGVSFIQSDGWKKTNENFHLTKFHIESFEHIKSLREEQVKIKEINDSSNDVSLSLDEEEIKIVEEVVH